MAITADILKEVIFQQQKQFEESQHRLISTLSTHFDQSITTIREASESQHNVVSDSIQEFHYNPDQGHTFDKWYLRYAETFSHEFPGRNQAWKRRLLVRKLGPSEFSRFSDYILPKEPGDLNFQQTVAQLKTIFGKQKSLFHTRFNCLQLKKSERDDYITYAGTVNRQCEDFKLSSITENHFKCLIFIAGLDSPHDAELRTKLLAKFNKEQNITLQDLTTECQQEINLKQDAMLIQQPATACTNAVGATKPSASNAYRVCTKFKGPGKIPPTACWNCGGQHYSDHCPFKKHVCQKCMVQGHKEGFCKQAPRGKKPAKFNKFNRGKYHKKHHQTHSVSASFKVDFKSRRKYITATVNNFPVEFQFDTASDISIISRATWEQMGQPAFTKTNHSARSASGDTIQIIGELPCAITFKDKTINGKCYISDCAGLDLFGLEWIEELDLFDVPLTSIFSSCQVKSDSEVAQQFSDVLRNKFQDVFQESLGCCTKAKAVLKLKPDAKPVFRPKRPVPYAALDIVEAELTRLQDAGVIEPVNYSAWAAPIVVVRKANGKVRVCADYSTGLNDSLDLHQYPLPLPQDIFTKLNGGKCFAKIDLSDAFLQMEVDEDSKELLTINTHKGLFKLNRLQFGVKSAPAIFQQAMDSMLSGLPDIAAYIDDILIAAKSQDELLNKQISVFERIQQYGFHVRPEKCEFFKTQIKYLGFIFDKDGRRPNPDNISAIKAMPIPKNLKTLRSFLGLVSHYSSFLPELHKVRGPLNQLLKKDMPWNWSAQCQASFEKVKCLLSSDLLLTNYDPSLEISLTTDASEYGIGAVITHIFPDGSQKAIAHASRSMTSTEKNYGQIEKEGLAIVFAVKHFHKMLYGREFSLITDHKPLISIFGSKKGIPVCTANRLQRWATTLLGYNFKIRYLSTDKIGHADALSRLISSQRKSTEDIVISTVSVEPDILAVFATTVRALPVTAKMIQEATSSDPVLQKVLDYNCTKWPTKITDTKLQAFHRRQSSLSVVEGCLLFGERVVVPTSLQNRVLKQFHSGHQGINRMKALARSYVYWPNMDTQLEQLVNTCTKCQLAAKAPRKNTLCSWPISESPWTRIHIDFAGPIKGHQYLVLVDSFSKWPEIFRMKNITAEETILKLQEVFSRFGTPETLVSDNGTSFTSAKFSDFCKVNGINHIRTPPYSPASNGQAERFVDTFKRTLQKLEGEGTPPEVLQIFLSTYRATPNPRTPKGNSPAEALMNRKIRLPVDIIRPKPNQARTTDTKMEKQYNKHHGAVHRVFTPFQSVLAKDYRNGMEKWTPGHIVRRSGKTVYVSKSNQAYGFDMLINCEHHSYQ